MKDTIIIFFGILEKQIQGLQYGTISGNVLISKGLPVVRTLNLVLSKRKRYKIEKKVDIGDTP